MGFLQSGQTEQAYHAVLTAASEPDLMRLMRRSGPCLHLVSASTRAALLKRCAAMLGDSESEFVGDVLPWVSQAVQMGVLAAGAGTPPQLAAQLTQQLYALAGKRTGVGAHAARLHAFLKIQSLSSDMPAL